MNAFQVYRQTQAQTAAPGELVVMLYRGAVRFVTTAVAAIEAKDIQAAHTSLLRAQAIVSELQETRDSAAIRARRRRSEPSEGRGCATCLCPAHTRGRTTVLAAEGHAYPGG